MDDVFKNLQKQSQNYVSNLIKWIQASNVVEPTEEGDQQAEALFGDKKDKLVTFEKFQQVVTQLASDQKKSFDDVADKLANEGPRFMKAVEAGYKAFTDTLKKEE